MEFITSTSTAGMNHTQGIKIMQRVWKFNTIRFPKLEDEIGCPAAKPGKLIQIQKTRWNWSVYGGKRVGV